MSFFQSQQPIVIPDPVDVGVQSVTAGSNVTITGTALDPIVNSFNFNNFVSYNIGGGFEASPFTIADLSNGAFELITTIDHTISYPQSGGAYQLTFSWILKNASFAFTPSGNVYALVLSGPTLNTGTVIGQSACFVNANIGNSPPNAGPVALGTCSCLIYNDNGTDVSIAFANFSGETITAAELEIFSVSVTFLSSTPTVVSNF
jgi:hypothetical protein